MVGTDGPGRSKQAQALLLFEHLRRKTNGRAGKTAVSERDLSADVEWDAAFAYAEGLADRVPDRCPGASCRRSRPTRVQTRGLADEDLEAQTMTIVVDGWDGRPA